MAGSPEFIRIGCSGWYYAHWAGVVYPRYLPRNRWFAFYRDWFSTVELNSTFYRFPQESTARAWLRHARPGFSYSLKVNREITHDRRFQGTRRLIRSFYQVGNTLGDHLGCFLFQLPPDFHFSHARLASILVQLESRYRNVVEFRHPSWWNPIVFAAFRRARVTFCSLSSPRFSEEVVRTSDLVYVRFHGAGAWYGYDYSDQELQAWAEKIRHCGAKEVWAYFNNDPNGCAFRNAARLRELLA